MEPSLAMLGWLMENREPGSSLCKTHPGLPEVSSTSSREGWRMEKEEAQGAEGHICLAVSHLGPAHQTQVGNTDSALVFSS